MSGDKYWERATPKDINVALDTLAEHSPNYVRMIRTYIRKLERKARG